VTIQLPYSPLPGADVPGSTAEAQQANNDALATAVVPAPPFKVGSATVTWPGGSPYANTTPIAHGYTPAPRAAVATADLPAGGFAFEMSIAGIDATNVNFRGHTTDGSSPLVGTTRTFYYLIAQ
jgi:hypothetical protein